MKFSSCSYITMLVINAAGIVAGAPAICMMTPPITVQAGSVITAIIDNLQRNRCEATLKFTNPDFLPIHFGFQSLNCLGPQMAEIIIPSEVPNGDAYILWQCANLASPICSHALITGGIEDANSIVLNQYGKISCVAPNATLTTTFGPNGILTTITEIPSSPTSASSIETPLSTFTTVDHSWTNSSTHWITPLANSSANSSTPSNRVTTTCIMSS